MCDGLEYNSHFNQRMTKIEIYTSCLFVLVVGMTADVILGLYYNFYGHFSKGPDLPGFLTVFGIYPAFNTILLNYFPYHKKLWDRVLYIAISSGACLVYEWLSLKSGAFYYTVWKLWYSAICYPILITIMVWNLSLIKKMMKRI